MLVPLLLCGPVAADADCPVLALDGPVEGERLAGQIADFADPDATVTAASAMNADGGRFRINPTGFVDHGYTTARIWVRICVTNMTKGTSDWRFYAHENFFQVFEVHIAREDGSIQTVMSLGPNSPFTDRPLNDPQMVAPMTIAPGESATILMAYASGGSSQVDFSIEPLDNFLSLKAAKTAKNFFFYGMMMLLIFVALVSLLVFRNPVFLAYCAYAASALLFVMHEDGVAFQFIWPQFPTFNSHASIFVGSALIVSGAIYARIFLKTAQRHPRIDLVLVGLVVGTVLLDVTLFILDPQILKKILVMVSLLAFLTFTAAGVWSYFAGYREVRFYMLAWLGVMLSSLLMNLRHVVGLEIEQATVHDSMRAVMVLDAMMMGLAIADRYNQLRRSRQVALEENLTFAQHRLELNRRLSDLTERHEQAVRLARSRDKHIQNLVHDLRQPLHALRLNVMNLQPGPDKPVQAPDRMEAAFSYLEGLISQHLETQPGPTPEAQTRADGDGLGLQDVLGAIREMFEPDARAKGLSLRLNPAAIETPVDALVLTRIVSNLVSNAIKYTDAGGVLIGTRTRGGAVRVEVHDSGPGLDPEDFARASQREVRLERDLARAQGNGLGLAIAIELAEKHGMRIELCPGRRRGTGLALVIPATQDMLATPDAIAS